MHAPDDLATHRQHSTTLSPAAPRSGTTTPDCSEFPNDRIRATFPALIADEGFVFFDNAAGAQAPQVVLDAVQRHLLQCNVQRGGRYSKSQEVDATIARARES